MYKFCERFKFRILMEDQVNGEKFKFAIFVDGENRRSSEDLAKSGMTVEDGARINAMGQALREFPEAKFLESTKVSSKHALLK